VYSLGVVLYELLVGALPFDPKELRRVGFDEIRRRVREDEPSKPSTRFITVDNAKKRQTDPISLARQLRKDLDWITMRALEKDRTRRYGSPTELANDVRRHLRCEPVMAGPQRVSYRLTKFVHRHRRGLAVAAVASVVFSAITIVLAWQALMLAVERQVSFHFAESTTSTLRWLDWKAEDASPISFGIDLDLLAPLGSGTQNAAKWFADFSYPDGPRLAEWRDARKRFERVTGEPGVLLLPDDPLLLEAEAWVDQAVMRFYPDVWNTQELNRTQVPNALMMMDLARAWVDRGDARKDLDAALEDYRLAVRLGRLLRQEDLEMSMGLMGLSFIRRGLQPMARRFREAGEDRLAEQTLLALADLLAQRLTYIRVLQSTDIEPYLGLSWFGSRLRLPKGKMDEIGRLATEHPERRFRRLATGRLCLIHWLSRGDRKALARDWMDQVAASGDPVLVWEAECDEDQVREQLGWLFRVLRPR